MLIKKFSIVSIVELCLFFVDYKLQFLTSAVARSVRVCLKAHCVCDMKIDLPYSPDLRRSWPCFPWIWPAWHIFIFISAVVNLFLLSVSFWCGSPKHWPSVRSCDTVHGPYTWLSLKTVQPEIQATCQKRFLMKISFCLLSFSAP